MTDKNLEEAKKKYDLLIKEKKRFLKIKEEFFDFILNDQIIQEFIALKDWNYFKNRYLELTQEETVKQYLYLMSKYNNFEEKNDNDLVDEAFRCIINDNDSSNIYVYLNSYTFNEDYEKQEVKNKKDAIAHEYINLETAKKKLIPIDEIVEFKKNNQIINFKNKRYKPIELFYRYRIMYLRQFLLDNHYSVLKKEHKIKKLKIINRTK
ncbi:MAG: hypothetical protein IKF19_03300 [Bacilli bacterium]|nr:hypothetical protein [Bacilli bacterium]